MTKLYSLSALLFALVIGTIHGVAQPVVSATIEANNVKAQANTAGLLFNNIGLGSGAFIAPKGPGGPSSIYASTLWIGGLDNGGNLHMAAQTYRQAGNDFHSGPIDQLAGTPVNSVAFDSLWRITKADYLSARQGVWTDNLRRWPVSYTTANGTYKLAPFHDANNDGKMDVSGGLEYPIFPGDEALFFVYNDKTLHGETSGSQLGVEVAGFMYQIKSNTNEYINNTVFVDYYITNKSSNTYFDVSAGIWTDFDLGNYADDRIGSDSARNMYYAYNGDDNDEGLTGYGNTPAAMCVMFINQPMYATMGYGSDFSVVGNPILAEQYYGYTRGIWKDGSPLTYGGNGYNTGSRTRYTLSGNPCANTGWTEQNSGVGAGDRRMLGSVNLDTLLPGGVKKISLAYLWSRSATGGAKGSLCKMFDQADSLINWTNNNPPLSAKNPATETVKIYPNPATSAVTIETGEENIKVSLFDISGREVLSSTQKTIDISGLTKGIYVVRGTAGTNYISQKILVQ